MDSTQYGSEMKDSFKEVSWQTAWWSLVPLAIGTMIQPCGNILGYKDKNFRFYIRASPLICIADVVHFTIIILLGSSLNRQRFIKNIKYELNVRFNGDSTEHDIQNAENTRLMRIVLLVVAGIPCQTIKLVAMTGIPWTKTWALMYFISICFGESLIILARSNRLNSPVILAPPNWRGHGAISTLSSFTEGNTLAIPVAIYYGVAVTTIFSIMWHYCDHITESVAIWRGPVVAAVLGFLFITIPIALTYCLLLYLASKPYKVWTLKVFFLIGTSQIICTTALFTFLQRFANWNALITYNFPFAGYAGYLHSKLIVLDRPQVALPVYESLFTLGKYIFGGFVHVTVVALSLLLTFMMPVSILDNKFLLRVFKIDTLEGAQAVVVFITTFGLSLGYYSGLYLGEGTRNPSWVGVFG
ncbi:hypothetical protein ONS95_007021 [Cadophora gregata]|uniref:uncharacterized protein n=1 Tax=Cadophora gregata TaxID=51156 RepID=UPI0026DAE39D|nr:uncharacterized protein ONS95_007021 [Cadophora gregata]KAK0100561.1 hypothetical protein ONS95_007021 [Cadophora gregata]